MASEYLLKKYKDVKPDEVRVLTKEEKRRNWWAYHKWHVVIGAVLLLCLCNILWHVLGIGQVKPDVSIAYIGAVPLSEVNENALRQKLEEYCGDLNGDGKITVAIAQYNAINTGDSDSLYYAQAAQVRLVSDVTDCVSFLFLMEDPGKVQEATSVLCNIDGTLPRDGDLTPDGKYVMLQDCSALSDLCSSPAFSDLAIGRRGFWTKKTVDNLDGCIALWETITAK